jgi:N-acetylneuraminic acid mutarotase
MSAGRFLRPLLLVTVVCCFTLFFTPAQVHHAGTALSPENNSAVPDQPAYTPLDWYPLSNKGLKGSSVSALAVDGDDLYVGGKFTGTYDGKWSNLGNIARYNIKTGTWYRLPNEGLDGPVYALLVHNDNLYVGGSFNAITNGFTGLGNIVRLDLKTNKWHRMPNSGFDSSVYSLAGMGNNVYIGGGFENTGDLKKIGFNCMARYDITNNTFNQLSNMGLWGSDPPKVFALQVSGIDLYVGGDFEQTSDYKVKNLNNIARYDTVTDSWHALPHDGLGGGDEVYAMALTGEMLYMAGSMTGTNDGFVKNMGYFTRFDISSGTWHEMPHQGLDRYSYAAAVSGEDAYVGGGFKETYDGSLKGLNYIARYDLKSNTWHPVINLGLNKLVSVMGIIGNNLYVGGDFSETMDGAVPNLNLIARLELDAPQFNGYLPLVVKH